MPLSKKSGCDVFQLFQPADISLDDGKLFRCALSQVIHLGYLHHQVFAGFLVGESVDFVHGLGYRECGVDGLVVQRHL